MSYSSGKNTEVDYHALLQGIFLTQGLNLCLMSPALASRFFTTSAIFEAQLCYSVVQIYFLVDPLSAHNWKRGIEDSSNDYC